MTRRGSASRCQAIGMMRCLISGRESLTRCPELGRGWMRAQFERLLVGGLPAKEFSGILVDALAARNRHTSNFGSGPGPLPHLVRNLAMRELRFLQALGLLEIDTHTWTRPALAKCLASAVVEASRFTRTGHPVIRPRAAVATRTRLDGSRWST